MDGGVDDRDWLIDGCQLPVVRHWIVCRVAMEIGEIIAKEWNISIWVWQFSSVMEIRVGVDFAMRKELLIILTIRR